MVRQIRYNAESRDRVKYWCCDPNCHHYIRDHLSFAFAGSYPKFVDADPVVTDPEDLE